MGKDKPLKFSVGDRVKVVEKLFPSFAHGLFDGLKKTGRVTKVEPDSILPYQAVLDGFEHHPFWFYANQLEFEDDAEAEAWEKRQKAQTTAE